MSPGPSGTVLIVFLAGAWMGVGVRMRGQVLAWESLGPRQEKETDGAGVLRAEDSQLPS